MPCSAVSCRVLPCRAVMLCGAVQRYLQYMMLPDRYGTVPVLYNLMLPDTIRCCLDAICQRMVKAKPIYWKPTAGISFLDTTQPPEIVGHAQPVIRLHAPPTKHTYSYVLYTPLGVFSWPSSIPSLHQSYPPPPPQLSSDLSFDLSSHPSLPVQVQYDPYSTTCYCYTEHSKICLHAQRNDE